MKSLYLLLGFFLCLLYNSNLQAQKGFNLVTGMNAGTAAFDEGIKHQNFNLHLGAQFYEAKLRIGLKYSKYFVSTYFDRYDFTVSTIYVQGGFRPVKLLRCFFEVHASKGDYGQNRYREPIKIPKTRYIGAGGGIEYRIYRFIDLTAQLNTMVPIFHNIDYPNNDSLNIPCFTMGISFVI